MNEESEQNKEKIIRLVEYLTALAKINSKIVRSIDEYRKIIWIHTIPHEPKYCFTQVWETCNESPQPIKEIKKFEQNSGYKYAGSR